MTSKQLADVGFCLDDESHPLYLTPSDLDQTCQNVHSLLQMTDEEAGNQFKSREDEEAADFLTQLVQNNSNDSSGLTSKKDSNKRKAIANNNGQTVKKPKGSRTSKQDPMSTGNKQTDFVEQYFIKQERLKSLHGKAQIRINNLKKVLLTLKSEESAIENSSQKSSLGHATAHITNVIESISSELQSSGEIDSCRVCKNEDNQPTVISKTCGHGFCCISCIMKYLDYVYNKNSGRLICLKCKHQYDENATYQVGSRYGIIGYIV